MKKHIQNRLIQLQEEHHIQILYAVESGSRAWGFASRDSDWDVRFIYVHPPEWYLSIDEKKDTLEAMLPNDIDLAGWELKKALKLFRKSNPPLMEWLISPLVYIEQYATAAKMRILAEEYFSPKSCIYHYLHMAEGNVRAYLKEDKVRLKKYFYMLRPVLACKWIDTTGDMAPMEFDRLVETQVKDHRLKDEISRLLVSKKNGEELDVGSRLEVIDEFLEKEIAYFQEKVKDYDPLKHTNTDRLNELFRETLKEVWGSY